MEELVFTGIQPVKKGGNGNRRWFVIADSGTFSIDKNITADIWLVGGGCNGGDGEWIESEYTALGAIGGDGGYVSTYTGINLKADEDNISIIAFANDKSGTSLTALGNTYVCDELGHTQTKGGQGSSLTGDGTGKRYTINQKPGDGISGVSTPYGYVGSSGGGGMACDGHNNRTDNGKGGTGAGNGGAHRQEGADAQNYGCGGGGGDGCGAVKKGNVGGNGVQGCIIVQYTIDDEEYIDPVDNPSPPPRDLPEPPEEYIPEPDDKEPFIIIRNYRRITTVRHKQINNAAASSSSCCCCTTDNDDCGCDSSLSSNSYLGENSGTVSNANYIDSLNIKSNNLNADELALKIHNLEIENLALLKQISEFESKLGIT